MDTVVYGDGREKLPGTWDYMGSVSPYPSAITFSLGLFQWIPRNNGKGVKKGKVKRRVKGYCGSPQKTVDKVSKMCDDLNKKILE